VARPDAPVQTGSLTEWLRRRSDDELAALLRRRPDLALPAPADLATLAMRIGIRTSVQRAVDGLDALALRLLEALVLHGTGSGPVALTDVRVLLPEVSAGDLDRAFDELIALALVWGDADAAHLVAGVREAVGPYPAGLGRPAHLLLRQVSDVALVAVLRTLGLPAAGQPHAGAAVAAHLDDPVRLGAALDTVDDEERGVLERLAAGPPVGTVRNAHLPPVWPAAETAPAPHRLMMRGLLVPIDAQTVELPREVGLAMRGDHPLGQLSAAPPELPIARRSPAELDRAGTTAVLDVLRLVDGLAEAWTAQPPPMLRSGGVGVRDLRRTARDLGVDEERAALVIETANAAGLIGATTGMEPVYLPTTDYDGWREQSPAARWAELACAWLAMSRQPSLVGQRGERDRLITVLGPDAERGTTPTLRRSVLDLLMTLPAGSAPTSRTAVLDRLTWSAPRRGASQRPLAEAVLVEADTLGVTAAGGLTGYSRTLLDGSRPAAERALAAALPEPVNHFLVQPDLTVVVPGPPAPALAEMLSVTADLESTGGATVYRITEQSVRRALDAGHGAGQIAAFVMARSQTPVPQALTYLIEDVARRHGVLRAGTASCYLRCDDEALLARVLADRDLAPLNLHRISATVVISALPVARVLEGLRQSGYAPAAEGADGAVVALGAEKPRAPSRNSARVVRPRTSLESAAQLSQLVRRIRSGDTLTELSARVQPVAQQVPGVTSARTMALLRQAIREGRRVLLGAAEADGTASRHTILPISLAGGFVRGHDATNQRLQSFPLHRLTAVSIVADEDADDNDIDNDIDDEAGDAYSSGSDEPA
jgi:XPB/Ssl2-like helicase family protein